MKNPFEFDLSFEGWGAVGALALLVGVGFVLGFAVGHLTP